MEVFFGVWSSCSSLHTFLLGEGEGEGRRGKVRMAEVCIGDEIARVFYGGHFYNDCENKISVIRGAFFVSYVTILLSFLVLLSGCMLSYCDLTRNFDIRSEFWSSSSDLP